MGTAPSPGTPRRDSRWPNRGGARRCRQGKSPRRLDAPAGYRSPASKPLSWSVFLTLFSQIFIMQPHQSRACSLALLLLLLLLLLFLYRALLSRQVCRHGCRSFAYIILISCTAVGSHKWSILQLGNRNQKVKQLVRGDTRTGIFVDVIYKPSSNSLASCVIKQGK